jgi:hypothetical protein
VPCRKIGREKYIHAACRHAEKNLYAYSMQKSIYGHVKNEKIMLGRTGSFAIANFSSLLFQFVIVVMLNVTYVLHLVFMWVISNRELPAFLLFWFPVLVLFI